MNNIPDSREAKALVAAIEHVLQVYKKEITLDSTFDLDLGADSLDMAQILRCTEEELGISIDIESLTGIYTVNDALNAIMNVTGSSKDDK